MLIASFTQIQSVEGHSFFYAMLLVVTGFLWLLFLGLSISGWSYLDARLKGMASIPRLVVFLSFPVLFGLLHSTSSPFINKHDLREYDMTWQVTEKSEFADWAKVKLTFASYPAHHFELTDASKLAAFLESEGEQVIRVRVPVLSDFGRVKSVGTPSVVGTTDRMFHGWTYVRDHDYSTGLLDWWYEMGGDVEPPPPPPSPWE